jgi:hypothetical protein
MVIAVILPVTKGEMSSSSIYFAENDGCLVSFQNGILFYLSLTHGRHCSHRQSSSKVTVLKPCWRDSIAIPQVQPVSLAVRSTLIPDRLDVVMRALVDVHI